MMMLPPTTDALTSQWPASPSKDTSTVSGPEFLMSTSIPGDSLVETSVAPPAMFSTVTEPQKVFAVAIGSVIGASVTSVDCGCSASVVVDDVVDDVSSLVVVSLDVLDDGALETVVSGLVDWDPADAAPVTGAVEESCEVDCSAESGDADSEDGSSDGKPAALLAVDDVICSTFLRTRSSCCPLRSLAGSEHHDCCAYDHDRTQSR